MNRTERTALGQALFDGVTLNDLVNGEYDEKMEVNREDFLAARKRYDYAALPALLQDLVDEVILTRNELMKSRRQVTSRALTGENDTLAWREKAGALYDRAQVRHQRAVRLLLLAQSKLCPQPVQVNVALAGSQQANIVVTAAEADGTRPA